MLDGFFKLAQRQTTVRTEIIAGATTFLTMAYIIFVNPDILAAAGMDKAAVIGATCLITAIATIATGVIANTPIAMAPGMGLNAFFAYNLVITQKISFQTALGAVFVSGALFFILTVLGLRKKLVEAIDASLISAVSVGIGLFITFIGLKNLGIVIDSPATLVQAANLDKTILIGLAGLAVMLFLEMKKIKGALLAGIIFSTVLAMILGEAQRPAAIFSANIDISAVAFRLDILGSLKWGLAGSIFSLMFMDMFDSIGTLAACCSEAKLADKDGKIAGLDKLLAIDAAATMAGAVLGTSTTTSYIESAAGIEQGARSGLASVATGILFLAAVFFTPLVGVVPSYAAAPALIMVGLFMMKEVKRIDFSQLHSGFPAFIIIIMIALSYSISTGLAFGFISFTAMKAVSRRAKEIKPAMWIITTLSLLYFLLPIIRKSG